MGVTVVCVLRTGGDFDDEHVSRLYDSVVAHWPNDSPRFVVLTDAPADAQLGGYDCCLEHRPERRPLTRDWPHWWAKMELFAPEHDDLGRVLYIDLDTIIVGDLSDILRVRATTLLNDFYREENLQSGVMMLSPAARAETWERWNTDPARQMGAFRGDGQFLHRLWKGRATTWQQEAPGQVVSYKVDVKPRAKVPAGARLVCFHGKPRPWSVRWLWD